MAVKTSGNGFKAYVAQTIENILQEEEGLTARQISERFNTPSLRRGQGITPCEAMSYISKNPKIIADDSTYPHTYYCKRNWLNE